MGPYLGIFVLILALVGGVWLGRLLLAFLRSAREDIEPTAMPAPETPETQRRSRLAIVAALAQPRARRTHPRRSDETVLDGEVLPPRHADPLAAAPAWHDGRGLLVRERA